MLSDDIEIKKNNSVIENLNEKDAEKRPEFSMNLITIENDVDDDKNDTDDDNSNESLEASKEIFVFKSCLPPINTCISSLSSSSSNSTSPSPLPLKSLPLPSPPCFKKNCTTSSQPHTFSPRLDWT